MPKPHHQTAMDRAIKRRYPKWLWPAVQIGGLVFAVGIALWLISDTERVYRIGSDAVTVGAVEYGEFEHYITIRGEAVPLRTVILDSPEGGVVEEIFVENGARVATGDELLRLSNTGLQLDVIRSDAEVTDQLNNLSQTELNLEKNRLQHKETLLTLDYEISRLERKVKQDRELAEKGYIELEALEQREEDLAYKRKRRELTRGAQETDLQIQEANMTELSVQVGRLRANLQVAQDKLEALNVRAPVDGQLIMSLEFDVGQSLAAGTRIGRIDDPENVKIAATVDEFHLNRLAPGQTAVLDYEDNRYNLRLRSVYPEVRNGTFRIDLVFVGGQPAGIRRGQTLQARLTLSDPEDALRVPAGGFTRDTGGTWVFVVSENGNSAVRREVTLGRRNDEFVEVIGGLEAGERIVTSSYQNYLSMDRLEFDAP